MKAFRSAPFSAPVDQTSRCIRKTYGEEFEELIASLANFEAFRHHVAAGQLKGTRYRSICWRVLLGSLSRSVNQWPETIKKNRAAFASLKSELNFDPHCDTGEPIDPSVNNPLSLHEQSPWNQYFSDRELLSCIEQDVSRTYPELPLFQSVDIRRLLRNILFLYARQNPQISYKQGMHEVLAPLVFCLYFDQQAFAHASEVKNELGAGDHVELLRSLCDPSYLLADAYDLFSRVMAIIQPWYFILPEHIACIQRVNSIENISPFSRPQDTGPGSAIVRKLNYIGDDLLKDIDVELYCHLEKLEIAPQIYGIRWLRLLYGREFPIQDLLIIWDAIFASGPPFAVIDYIFVAMLVAMRDLLLNSDYTGCLSYLMKYPAVADVQSLLELAFHYEDPVRFARPAFYQSLSYGRGGYHNHSQLFSLKSFDVAAGQKFHISNGFVNSGVHPKTTSQSHAFGHSSSRSFFQSAFGKKKADGSRPPPKLLTLFPSTSSANIYEIPRSPGSINNQGYGGEDFLRYKNRTANVKRQTQNSNDIPFNQNSDSHLQCSSNGLPQNRLLPDNVELMKEQISSLQIRLDDVESTSHYVAEKLLTCSDSLNSSLRELNIPSSDSVYQAVSDLKHMSYTLQGLIRPPGELILPLGAAASVNTPVEIGTDVSKQEAQQLLSSLSNSSCDDSVEVLPGLSIGAVNELKELKTSKHQQQTSYPL